MAELGPTAPALHAASGAEAAARGVEVLVAVGAEAAAYLDGSGPGVEGHRVDDAGAALDLAGDARAPR